MFAQKLRGNWQNVQCQYGNQIYFGCPNNFSLTCDISIWTKLNMPIHYITTLHAWNSRIVPLLGFPLNTLLFWLIWTKTRKEMRVHSRILLQTCILDITLLLVNLIATPMIFRIPKNSVKIAFFDGYLLKSAWALFKHHQIFLQLWGFTIFTVFFFDLFGISAQFIYRYLVLNRNVCLDINRYLLLLAFPFGVSFLLSFVYFIFDAEIIPELDENIWPLLNNSIDLNNSVYIALRAKDLNIQLWINAIIYPLCIVICFIVNIICGIKMVAFVKSHANYNPSMKELNRQLTKNLMILATFQLVSFFYAFIDVIVYLLCANPDIYVHVQFFYNMIGTWITVANPMVSIWINRPYRDAVIQLFKKNTANSVNPNPAITY